MVGVYFLVYHLGFTTFSPFHEVLQRNLSDKISREAYRTWWSVIGMPGWHGKQPERNQHCLHERGDELLREGSTMEWLDLLMPGEGVAFCGLDTSGFLWGRAILCLEVMTLRKLASDRTATPRLEVFPLRVRCNGSFQWEICSENSQRPKPSHSVRTSYNVAMSACDWPMSLHLLQDSCPFPCRLDHFLMFFWNPINAFCCSCMRLVMFFSFQIVHVLQALQKFPKSH